MMFFTPENKERKKRKIEHKTNSCPLTSRGDQLDQCKIRLKGAKIVAEHTLLAGLSATGMPTSSHPPLLSESFLNAGES